MLVDRTNGLMFPSQRREPCCAAMGTLSLYLSRQKGSPAGPSGVASRAWGSAALTISVFGDRPGGTGGGRRPPVFEMGVQGFDAPDPMFRRRYGVVGDVQFVPRGGRVRLKEFESESAELVGLAGASF